MRLGKPTQKLGAGEDEAEGEREQKATFQRRMEGQGRNEKRRSHLRKPKTNYEEFRGRPTLQSFPILWKSPLP